MRFLIFLSFASLALGGVIYERAPATQEVNLAQFAGYISKEEAGNIGPVHTTNTEPNGDEILWIYEHSGYVLVL
jgi:hypothetical protein